MIRLQFYMFTHEFLKASVYFYCHKDNLITVVKLEPPYSIQNLGNAQHMDILLVVVLLFNKQVF